MNILIKSVEEVIPYENNPRINKEAVKYVAESIQQFGFKVPIIIDKNNVIIAGHTRLLAAKKLGIETVPCIMADDLTDEQVKAFRLADNKVAEFSEWDMDLLLQELEGIESIDMTVLGFEPEIEELDTAEAVDDEFEPVVPEEPKSKRGQIYQLGRHRLMCGDSTKEEDVAKLTDGELMDLVVTDPPYNVDYGSKAEAINKYGYKFSDRHIENDYMPECQFIEFLDNAFKNMSEMLKPGGAFYIWHASITVFEFETALRLNNLKSRQQLVWNKNAIVLGRQDYQWKHEPCLYGWKEGAAHYFIGDRTLTTTIEDEPLDFDKMKKEELIKLLEETYSQLETTVLNEKKPTRSELHPTMKPIPLIGRQIRNSSKPGQKVADLFGGSGTTLMACEQMNRKCYMMEYDPRFVDVIIERWEQYTG